MFGKKIKTKKIAGLLAVSILLNFTLLPASIVYADIVSTGAYVPYDGTNQGSSPDLFNQANFAADPTMVRNTGGGLDVGGAVGSCAKGLVGSIVGNLFSKSVGKFLGGLGGFGGGSEVPTSDSTVRDNTTADATKETGISGISMDGIAHCMGNMVIEGMLRSTISWVKGGFEGNPAFIDDPQRFFTDIADYELGQALNELSGGVLCSPWDVEIRLGLLNRYGGSSQRRGRCTLTDIIDNADRFVDGHFDEGGWDAWFELTQNPYNNPYTSYLNAVDMYETRVSTRNANAVLELNWADGWRSEKGTDGKTTTPGTVIQQQVSDTLNVPAERLTFADEFDELVNEMFNSLIGRVFEGL